MTIASAIQSAQQKVANAYTAISNKGGTLPATQDLSNMPTAIGTINTVNNTTLSVTPTTSSQSFTPSSPYTGYSTVSVSAVTSAIDSDIKASNIKSGVNILGVNGSVVELAGETRNVSITSTSGNTFTPSSGKNGITSITVTPTNQARTVTPTTSQQTLSVNSGYSGNGTITVNAVTSSIDANITAGNIKDGVTILGVLGTYTGSGGGGGLTNIYSNYIIKNNGDIEQLIKGTFTLDFTATTINTTDALYRAYYNNNAVIEVNLGSLKVVSGTSGLNQLLSNCSTVTKFNVEKIEELSAQNAMYRVCRYCTSLTTDINFQNLSILTGATSLREGFSYSAVKNIYFYSLKSTSFGSVTNQFNDMLWGCSNVTVHFPSNLQSVIGSWSQVTGGFTGTNTTVLFDLPATT